MPGSGGLGCSIGLGLPCHLEVAALGQDRPGDAGELVRQQIFRVASANDYDEIFARLAAEHFDAVIVTSHPLNAQNQTRVCQLALRHRIPPAAEISDWAKRGYLLSYAQDISWSSTRAVDYVDKILRGAKPSDLPVEQAVKLDLVINLKTAKTLGLAVPPSLLARADKVIE